MCWTPCHFVLDTVPFSVAKTCQLIGSGSRFVNWRLVDRVEDRHPVRPVGRVHGDGARDPNHARRRGRVARRTCSDWPHEHNSAGFTKLEPEPGKWPSFCKLSGRCWRLIWPPYRPQALHSNWCLKIVPFSVPRSGQINRQFTPQTPDEPQPPPPPATPVAPPPATPVAPPPTPYTVGDWEQAVARRRADQAHLRGVDRTLDETDRRAADLNRCPAWAPTRPTSGPMCSECRYGPRC